MAAPQTSSRLELLQARFQQRQMMEKEQKLLQLYDQQQQRAHQVAQRGSAGSNTSNGPSSANPASNHNVTKAANANHTSNSQGGKVRQMFDERRQTTVKGIDRSYPLEPLENKPRKNTGPHRNGNTITSRQAVTVKRTIRADKNGNINNGKPVVNYHEEVTSETFGPKLIHREEDLEEFYENDLNKWTDKNADKHSEASNDDISVNNQEKRAERFRYENKKKEATGNKRSESLSSLGSRKQESRLYRNMVKIELGRESPGRGKSQSPERIIETVKIRKSPGTPSSNERVQEFKGNYSAMVRERSKSPARTFTKPRSKERSPPRTQSPNLDEEPKRNVSMKRLNTSESPNPEDYYYPRRKSEFEKSRIFRKLREELQCDSPEELQNVDDEEAFRKEKSPSPVKFNDSFLEIKDYPRRTSTFEKSRTFNRIRSSLDADEKKANEASIRRQSSSPPGIVKSSYETIKETSAKRKNSKTTFHRLQEEFGRSSPECKPSPIVPSIDKDLQKKRKESEKSRTFLKLQKELSSSPESNSESDFIEASRKKSIPPPVNGTYRKKSPTTIQLQNDEIEISKSFPKLRQSWEPLKSVELLKDHFLLNEKTNASSRTTLDDVNDSATDSSPEFHGIVKKDKPRSPSPIEHSNSYGRTDSVESALRHYNSIDNVETEDSENKPKRKGSSDSRRSSLHAPTASWSMKTRSVNQHDHKESVKSKKTPKSSSKPKSTNSKGSKKSSNVKTKKVRDMTPSPPCKKRLFLDSESDIGSEDTKSSGKTITIERSFTETSMELHPTGIQPLKILRSIEDIRNSMTRESKLMRNTINKSTDDSIAPKVTIRIISPNSVRRTEFIKFNNPKSNVSSEISMKTVHRIEKAPTPDNAQSIDVIDGDNEKKFDAKENTNAKKSSAFVIELENSKSAKKAPNDKQSPEKISPESRQKVSSGRPASAVSTNSNCSSNQSNSSATKSRMATKTRGVTSANRTSISSKSPINASNTDNSLPACKICNRKFASDRITLHEQICSKTSQKKRKTFDPVVQRIKGTELEPFVRKISKKGSDKKSKKPEVKSNWRRKHEDFINAIRSAKQMQAHLAAGGKLSDLPPPPASDTSDYIQCPHCNRKFNQGAAERHIPKCETMQHNKPNPRAPQRQKR